MELCWTLYEKTEKEIYRVAVGFLYKKTRQSETEVLTIESSWKRITTKEDL